MNTYPFNPLTMGQATFNPYIQQVPVNPVIPNYQSVVQQGPHMEVQRVNGKESAYAYAIGPNSSVILVDNLQPKIWLVTTDSSGFKAVQGFTITPDEEEPIVVEGTVKDEDPVKKLNERLDKLEERVNSIGQSNSKSSWQSKPGNGCNQSNDRNGQSGKRPDGNDQSDGSK